jgi:mevalonate kinase
MPGASPQSAFAPGKVILLGEHAVVYGAAAIAGPLTWGATATAVPARQCRLELPQGTPAGPGRLLRRAFERAAARAGRPEVLVRLKADLPVGVGLGSSAALAVACARILLEAKRGRPAKADDVVALAMEMETVFHGKPSGIDHTTSALRALVRFRAGAARRLRCPKPLKLLVALAGPRRPTAQTVASLLARKERYPRRYGRLFQEIGRVADEAAKDIEAGNLEALGDAMNVNQGLLSALGVSSPSIDAMVDHLRGLGALGAKLTGAGGDGGAVLGLFLEPEPAVAKLSRLGIDCFGCQLAGPPAL